MKPYPTRRHLDLGALSPIPNIFYNGACFSRPIHFEVANPTGSALWDGRTERRRGLFAAGLPACNTEKCVGWQAVAVAAADVDALPTLTFFDRRSLPF